MAEKKRVAILGSTGSIGVSALEVVAAFADRLEVVGLAARKSVERLREQVRQFRPKWAVLTEETLRDRVSADEFTPAQLHFGEAALRELVASSDVDIVLVAIVGAAGLVGAWSAIAAGKTVALANKEALVCAGSHLLELARRSQALLLPVDSEHSAIFQLLHHLPREQIERIILTASGGPFREKSLAELQQVTAEQALKHPTWHMGPKITVDSATLMNKALEIIEARWWFDLPAERIQVLIHPESVVHGLVELQDGVVLAQLSAPDMRLPIQYALLYPQRPRGPGRRLDWGQLRQLHFEPPDLTRFPALELGYEVARRNDLSGAVLNAANEVAVELFLAGRCRFLDIVRVCRAVLEAYDRGVDLPAAVRWATSDSAAAPTTDAAALQAILAADRWARQEAYRCLQT
jgi:1-deoxy-D-xylulose-5-phosphate reductoisomerase